jgi:hypothetical protein
MTGIEEVRERIDEAVKLAVVGEVDLEDVARELEDAKHRVETAQDATSTGRGER